MNLSELVVIVGVAIAVLKPEKLPEMARAVGNAIRKAQSLFTSLQATVNEQVQLDALKENERKAKIADAVYNKNIEPKE